MNYYDAAYLMRLLNLLGIKSAAGHIMDASSTASVSMDGWDDKRYRYRGLSYDDSIDDYDYKYGDKDT